MMAGEATRCLDYTILMTKQRDDDKSSFHDQRPCVILPRIRDSARMSGDGVYLRLCSVCGVTLSLRGD